MNAIEKTIIEKARRALDDKQTGVSYAAGLLDALLSMPTDEDRETRRAIAGVFDAPRNGGSFVAPASHDKCPECARAKRHKQSCSIGRAAKAAKKRAAKEAAAAESPEREPAEQYRKVEPYDVVCSDCLSTTTTCKPFMDATCGQCQGIHVKKA